MLTYAPVVSPPMLVREHPVRPAAEEVAVGLAALIPVEAVISKSEKPCYCSFWR